MKLHDSVDGFVTYSKLQRKIIKLEKELSLLSSYNLTQSHNHSHSLPDIIFTMAKKLSDYDGGAAPQQSNEATTKRRFIRGSEVGFAFTWASIYCLFFFFFVCVCVSVCLDLCICMSIQFSFICGFWNLPLPPPTKKKKRQVLTCAVATWLLWAHPSPTPLPLQFLSHSSIDPMRFLLVEDDFHIDMGRWWLVATVGMNWFM